MLNVFKHIEREFQKTFASQLNLPNLHKEIKKLTFVCLKTPLIIFALSGIFQFLATKHIILEDLIVLSVRFFGFLTMATLTLATQLFYLLICHVVTQIYKAVHEQVLISLNKITAKTSLDGKTITKWKLLLLILAKQMRYIGDFFSLADSVHIVVRVMNLSISVYTVLRSFSELIRNEEFPTGSLITVTQVIVMAWVS